MDVLTLNHVSRQFGELKVIDDLSFSVQENSVFGLIGKNGAGKTTTMKMILGLLKPNRGEITVCGGKVVYGGAGTNRRIGYLPDVPEYYGYMTPAQYLQLCGEITGMPSAKIREKSPELLEMVGLKGVNRKIHGFSRGMKQRLGIAQALLSEPKLLICDEPTSALDPIGRKEILEILCKVKGRTTVVFSTHILSDVERICDHIGVLNGGKFVLQGDLNEIKSRHRRNAVLLELDEDEQKLRQFAEKLCQLPFTADVANSGRLLTVALTEDPESGAKLFSYLAEQKVSVLKYEVMEPDLENLFLEAVE